MTDNSELQVRRENGVLVVTFNRPEQRNALTLECAADLTVKLGGRKLLAEPHMMAKGKFASYLRVSTDRHGRSGLGLEAQRAAVSTHLEHAQ